MLKRLQGIGAYSVLFLAWTLVGTELGAQFGAELSADSSTVPSPSPSPHPLASPSCSSEPALSPHPGLLPSEVASLLGLRLSDAWLAYGCPSEVYALRGEEPWQDDVVFSYESGYSFFWYKDRLWQVRFRAPYHGPVYGIFLGDTEEKLVSTLGQPFADVEGSRLFRLPYRGFELRLRAVIREGRLVDVYVYRADF